MTATKIGGKWEITEGVPVISANNINNGLFVEMNSVKRINEDLFKKWMPVKLRKGDVLLVSEGATFGELLYLGENLKAALGQRLFSLRCNFRYEGKYLYYYLRSKKGQQELSARTTGTSVLGIRQSELMQIMVPDIPIEEQKVVGDTLGALDSKIRLNQEMNKTLEAVGQAVFKRWFVDFEFPNEEGKPYKSSGGPMIESELGKIPEGWKVDRLGNHASIKGRIGWKGLQVSEYVADGPRIVGGTQLMFGRVNWDASPSITKMRYDESPEIMLRKGDILMTKDGTIGKLAYVDEVKEPATVASGIFVIRSSSSAINQIYLLSYFKSDIFNNLVESRIEGSVVPHLYQRDITDLLIVVPRVQIAERFELIVSAFQQKIDANSKSSLVLEKIRNALLPKLMSGKIRVPVMKEKVEAQ